MDTRATLIFISLALVSLILHKLCRAMLLKRSPKQLVPLPPGPTPIPIFGCLFQMLKHKSRSKWIHQVLDEYNTEIACIRLGSVHVIPVKSPELACEFLKRHDATFCSRPQCMSAGLASDGYLHTTLTPVGDQWNKMRRIIIGDVLSLAKHRWLHDKRAEEADHLVRYVLRQMSGNNGAVNLRMTIQHCCGNTMRKMVFSKRFFGNGAEDGGPGMEEEEHVDGLFGIPSNVHGFGISDYFPWLEVFDFGSRKKKLEKAIKDVSKHHDPEVDERIDMWINGMKEKEDDILDVLINLKDSNGVPMLTSKEIKAQITDLSIGSVDNPSNTVEWTMAEMINQPNILKRAQDELDNVVGKHRLVQESDLPKLNFIKACAKESLRLHPVALFNLSHVSTKDAIVSGYFIPKGSHVVLSRPGLGRNPRIWDHPLRYIPERHLHPDGSEVSLVDPELHVFSFSTGRRSCPAVLLGSIMTIMPLARLVQGFTWEAPNGDTTVDLAEEEEGMFLCKPLHAIAKARLSASVYDQLAQFY